MSRGPSDSPPDDGRDPTEIEERMLGLLEGADLPEATCDAAMKIVEQLQANTWEQKSAADSLSESALAARAVIRTMAAVLHGALHTIQYLAAPTHVATSMKSPRADIEAAISMAACDAERICPDLRGQTDTRPLWAKEMIAAVAGAEQVLGIKRASPSSSVSPEPSSMKGRRPR